MPPADHAAEVKYDEDDGKEEEEEEDDNDKASKELSFAVSDGIEENKYSDEAVPAG